MKLHTSVKNFCDRSVGSRFSCEREREREYLFVLCTLLDVDAVVVGGEVLGDIVSYPSSSSSRIGGK